MTTGHTPPNQKTFSKEQPLIDIPEGQDPTKGKTRKIIEGLYDKNRVFALYVNKARFTGEKADGAAAEAGEKVLFLGYYYFRSMGGGFFA